MTRWRRRTSHPPLKEHHEKTTLGQKMLVLQQVTNQNFELGYNEAYLVDIEKQYGCLENPRFESKESDLADFQATQNSSLNLSRQSLLVRDGRFTISLYTAMRINTITVVVSVVPIRPKATVIEKFLLEKLRLDL